MRCDFASSVAKSLSTAIDVAAREPVEERRLAGVRVADQRDRERAAARLALRVARAARSCCSSSLRRAMRVRTMRRSSSSCVSPTPRVPMPPACRSRCVHARVRRGSMYSSCASSTCVRASRLRARAGEDVEDQRAAVDDLRADDLLEVAHLRRREVVVEHHQRRAVCCSAIALISSALPLPTNVAGSGAGACAQDCRRRRSRRRSR